MAILTLEPIGHISTPFTSKADAPHQPDQSGAEGVVTLLRGQNFEQALEDLAGMEKIWLIYWFDRNPNWKPKVLVPRQTALQEEPGPRQKRGLFATRSPYRPNPIGMSLVDLVSVDGLTVRVRNVDLLDGTPILDIKPYLPAVEAHPDANAGWISAAEAAHRTPEYHVAYSELAVRQLEFLARYSVVLKPRIERVLTHDPSPHPYKRVESAAADADGYVQAIRGWRVHFEVSGKVVFVTEIASGYLPDSFGSSEALSDDAGQRAFRDRFGW